MTGGRRLLRAAVLVVSGLLVAGCFNEQLPPSALRDDLPRDREAAQAAFQARLEAAFPVGTEIAALRQTLADHAFELPGGRDYRSDWGACGDAFCDGLAFVQQDGLPCATSWTVYWTQTQGGALEEIFGYWSFACL